MIQKHFCNICIAKHFCLCNQTTQIKSNFLQPYVHTVQYFNTKQHNAGTGRLYWIFNGV